MQAWMERLLMRRSSTSRRYPEMLKMVAKVAKGPKIGNFPMDPTLGSSFIANSVPKTEITITITITSNKVIAIVIKGHVVAIIMFYLLM